MIPARHPIPTPEEAEAMKAVFTPSPLDLLDIARLRREHPDFANALAIAAGREFDARKTEGADEK